jgi:hypothetical protein
MLQLGIREFLPIKLSQLARRRDGIADLSPIHLLLSQVVQMVVEVTIVNLRFSLIEVTQPREEVAPDFAPLGLLQVVVVQG